MNKYSEACGMTPTAKSETPELERIIDQLNGELSTLFISRERLYSTAIRLVGPYPTDSQSKDGPFPPHPTTAIGRLWALKDTLRDENKHLQELANNFDKII